MRVLVLSPVPYEGAGCRFRIAQYIPYLAARGIEVTVAPFYDRHFFNLVYARRRHVHKALLFLKQALVRMATIARAGQYDAVWIYREAFPIGPPVLEALLRLFKRPLIYDFDDAVFLPNTSEANRYLAGLKCPQKVGWIIRRCDEVVAGNEFLATYARRFAGAVDVIPTAVDTNVFTPRAAAARAAGVPVVGWIGTPTTASYLHDIGPVLTDLAKKHAFTFRVSGAGKDVAVSGVAIETPGWVLEREVDLFNTCDIGVYPLPNDDWARGKCGFKAIQFMACGVPVVASRVGVNAEIIADGVNGFLASTRDEWAAKLQRLLEDPGLRERLGAAGRRTIEERYSLSVNAPRIAAVMERVVGRRTAAAHIQHAGEQR